MEKKLRYVVTAKDLPCRVEDLLKRRMALTKRQISGAKFRSKGICLNGKQVRVTAQPALGDVLEVVLEQESCGSDLERTAGMVEILYEDEDLLIVNKPAGMAVHPGHGHYRDTLANHLLCYLEEKGEPTRIRAVGRLDKDTSGVVVFAKNRVAAARLNAGGVKKTYLALVWGQFAKERGEICLPIGRREGALNRMEISEKGSWARTHYRVLREYTGEKAYTLVELWLDTGRTHQIRVHMEALGHPLLGDPIYGIQGGEERGTEIHRAALHCRQAELTQPFTGEKLRCSAGLPEDMEQYLLGDDVGSLLSRSWETGEKET